MMKTGVIMVCTVALWAAGTSAETLEDCLREATRANPGLGASREAVRKARWNRRGAYSDFIPQLSFGGSLGRGSSEQNDGTWTTGSSSSYGLSARQSLFAGGRNLAAVDQARASERDALAQYQAMRAEVSFGVKDAFGRLLTAQELIELTARIAARRRDDLGLVELRYEGGRENKGALLLTRAGVLQADLEHEQAGRDAAVGRQRLAQALGRPEGATNLTARGALAYAEPAGTPDYARLVRQTPEYEQVRAQRDISRAGVNSAESSFYPDVSARASYSRANDGWPPNQDNWFLGLDLSYAFFNGGRSIMNTLAAKAERQRVDASTRAQLLQVRQQLQEAYTAYQRAVDLGRVERALLEANTLRAEIARAQYNSGLMSFENWDIIENDLIRQQKSELQARLGAVLAAAQWERVRGLAELAAGEETP